MLKKVLILAMLGAPAAVWPAQAQTAAGRPVAGASLSGAAATSSPAAPPSAPSHAAAPSPAASATPAAKAPAAPAAPPQGLASNQFSSEQAAKAHCPGDAIVWANLAGSKAYHTANDRYYGKTKHGAFMCQKEADQAGYHAAGARASKAAAKTTNAKPTPK